MIQSLKTCWYWFVNLLANDKLKKPDKNTSINNTTNNLEENEIKIIVTDFIILFVKFIILPA